MTSRFDQSRNLRFDSGPSSLGPAATFSALLRSRLGVNVPPGDILKMVDAAIEDSGDPPAVRQVLWESVGGVGNVPNDVTAEELARGADEGFVPLSPEQIGQEALSAFEKAQQSEIDQAYINAILDGSIVIGEGGVQFDTTTGQVIDEQSLSAISPDIVTGATQLTTGDLQGLGPQGELTNEALSSLPPELAAAAAELASRGSDTPQILYYGGVGSQVTLPSVLHQGQVVQPQFEPRYFVSETENKAVDEFITMSPGARLLVKRKLADAGLLDPTEVATPDWSENAQDAMVKVMGHANRNASPSNPTQTMTWQEALDFLVATRPKPDLPRFDRLPFRKPNRKDTETTIKTLVKDRIGRNPTAAELSDLADFMEQRLRITHAASEDQRFLEFQRGLREDEGVTAGAAPAELESLEDPGLAFQRHFDEVLAGPIAFEDKAGQASRGTSLVASAMARMLG